MQNCNTFYPKIHKTCQIKYLFVFVNVYMKEFNHQLQPLKQLLNLREI